MLVLGIPNKNPWFFPWVFKQQVGAQESPKLFRRRGCFPNPKLGIKSTLKMRKTILDYSVFSHLKLDDQGENLFKITDHILILPFFSRSWLCNHRQLPNCVHLNGSWVSPTPETSYVACGRKRCLAKGCSSRPFGMVYVNDKAHQKLKGDHG